MSRCLIPECTCLLWDVGCFAGARVSRSAPRLGCLVVQVSKLTDLERTERQARQLCSMLRVTYNITWDGCNSDRLCKIMGKVEMFEHLMSVVSVNIRVMVAGP
jgi:hypothetical protein